VINAPCLKPFPDEQIKGLLSGVKGIITCEEHSVIGGLSQALAWAMRGDGRSMEAIAAMDVFGQSAYSHEELLAHYHL
ncbi:MAG: transketolase family protein, partial [Clostridia bacterium]